MNIKDKQIILSKVQLLVEEEGCYQDVMNVANLAWAKYKGKIDEILGAIFLLSETMIDKKTAQELLKNEHKSGHLNLSMFPNFRNKIIEISNKTK